MMPTAPSPDSAARSLRQRAAAWWARCRSHAVPCLYHPALFILMFILAASIHIYIAGLPGPLVRRIEDALNETGWDVSIDAVRWRPKRGWVMRRVVLYGARRDYVPLAEADAIQLHLSWSGASNRLSGIRSARIRNLTVNQILTADEQPPDEENILRMDHLDVYIARSNNLLAVSADGGRLRDIQLDAAGRIRVPEKVDPDAQWKKMLDTRFLWNRMARQQGYAENWRAKLNRLRVGDDTGIRMNFEVTDGGGSSSWCRVQWRGRDVSLDGAGFDAMAGQLVYTNGVVHVPEAVFSSSSGAAFVEGRWALDGRDAYVHVTNSLPAEVWRPLLPPAASAWMQEKGLYPGGFVRGEVTAGPAPAESLFRDLDAALEADRLTVRGAQVAYAAFQLSRRGVRWNITNGVFKIGAESSRGTMQVHGALDESKGRFEGVVDSTAYLDQMMTWYPTGIARRVAPLQCLSNAPAIRGRFGGETSDTGAVWFAADVAVADCIYRDVDIETMAAHVVYTNNRLRFDPIRVTRREGAAAGRVDIDYNRETVSMSITGALNPRAVARVIGPDVERILEDFDYRGPSRTVMNGRLDFGAHRTSDLEGSFEGREVAFMNYPMDTCAFTFTVVSNMITVSDIHALCCGGRMYGDLLFYVYTGNEPTRYAVQCKWENVGLRRFIAMTGGSETSAYRGLLHGQINATGRLGTNFEQTTEGVIKVSVTEGELSRLPLLGGLSQYLSRILPGLGYLSQQEFDAVGEIAHGRVYTENAKILGPSVSIKAIGKIHFDRRLDFRVRVQLLRRGAIADILRILTLPVSRLFEFRLRGTIDDPQWRPENLPKELFLIFE